MLWGSAVGNPAPPPRHERNWCHLFSWCCFPVVLSFLHQNLRCSLKNTVFVRSGKAAQRVKLWSHGNTASRTLDSDSSFLGLVVSSSIWIPLLTNLGLIGLTDLLLLDERLEIADLERQRQCFLREMSRCTRARARFESRPASEPNR